MGLASTKDNHLTAKQKAFCEAMIELNHNQTQSYGKAFPDASPDTWRQNSNKLMKLPKIVNYINQLEEEALRQAGITPARIAKELGKMAFAELDPENGLTYQVKQNAIKLLQSQFGLDKKVVDAKVDTIIKVDIEDDKPTSEE